MRVKKNHPYLLSFDHPEFAMLATILVPLRFKKGRGKKKRGKGWVAVGASLRKGKLKLYEMLVRQNQICSSPYCALCTLEECLTHKEESVRKLAATLWAKFEKMG